ncbi:tubulin-like doman-containing protein [Corynebacterium cystitidis]|uniref:tubulin-like doman-containing protein n=1 Tax=Corynebacterium cystitidis TaxID=35757 RepID=UPI00211EAF3F|nr:tubulin-like doman-containing protein [Corynebacterium cystitidis]
MYKILAVGCGGSGAKALSFMMDQLKTTLAEEAPNWFEANGRRLPAAWQFVVVDVPTQPEEEKAIPSVSQAGGQYISTGSTAGFEAVDRSVTSTLGRAGEGRLSSVATWAYEDPRTVTVPVDAGAGQYRGIGRMLILDKINEVARQLEEARNRINSAAAVSELDAIRLEMGQGKPKGEQSADPMTFVVSSMAGGAGASMAVDVCRLLSGMGLSNYEGRSALFMVTADVFKTTISEDKLIGAGPNALALFGELSAAQFGEGFEADQYLYEGLGHHSNLSRLPVGRVMPVGVAAGTNAVPIADNASPSTVYRALGRGLAALTTDTGMMDNFIRYVIGNPAPLPFDQHMYGWGLGPAALATLPWGSFGYGRLAMGRDRYAEYAAQRLAYSSVKRIVEGYKDPQNHADSDDDQLQERIDKTWHYVYTQLNGIVPLEDPTTPPGSSGPDFAHNWLYGAFGAMARNWAQSHIDRMQSNGYIPSPSGKRGGEWASEANSALANAFNDRYIQEDIHGLKSGRGSFYRAVYQWASRDHLQKDVLELLGRQVGKYGIAYGAAMLKELKKKLLTSASILKQMYPANGLSVGQDLYARLTAERGKLTGDGYLSQLYDQVYWDLYYMAVAHVGQTAGHVLEDFARNFLSDAESTFNAAFSELTADLAIDNDPDLGVAQLKTNVPRMWPHEETADSVPDRFRNAANEVMITEPSEYPVRFKEHVISSVAERDSNYDFNWALNEATSQIVHAQWRAEADAEKAPEDLLTLVEPWVPRALTFLPDTGEVAPESNGRLQVKIRAKHVLERARQFVSRAGYGFEQFINTTLRSYLLDAPNPQVQEQRRNQIAAKFEQAMTKALPLAQINSSLINKLYSQGKARVAYKFYFSTIPLQGDAAMAQRLIDVEQNYPNADVTSSNPLGGSLTSQGEQRAIDIYGSYPAYLPVVFDSILPSAAKQWSRETLPNGRAEYWLLKRARPVPAAVPLSPVERRAMVRGWYVGRLIGTTIFPGDKTRASDKDPIHIYDPLEKAWRKFDVPLLMPPKAMRTNYDWLPALLESITMAWAKISEAPELHSMDPYLALRRMWDAEETPQDNEQATMGFDLLREWLFDGQRRGGEAASHLMIPGTGVDATPEQRRDAAIAWLNAEGQRAMLLNPTEKLPADLPPQPNDKRDLADITSRDKAMQVPQLIDIASDVVDAAQVLIRVLEAAFKAGPPQQKPEPVNPFGLSSGSGDDGAGGTDVSDAFSGF